MSTKMPELQSLPEEVQAALKQFPEFKPFEFNESGANGYVLLGEHRVLNRQVALKVYFHDDGAIDQEPAMLARVDHENVLKVFDARKLTGNCSFYVTPKADEGDLSSFLKKYNLSTTLSHSLICQLLSGLAALHDPTIGIVHRDLKPENLLVHNDKIMIADFGSARSVDAVTGVAPASNHSILFRPPEAFGEGAFFDRSSDVYQAGLIGYLLFGGKLDNELLQYLTARELQGFKQLNQKDDFATSKYVDQCIEKRARDQTLTNWGSMPCFVPASLKRVLRKATRLHGDRYDTVSEFLTELARVRSTLPDWIDTRDGPSLLHWKGNDYLLERHGTSYRVKKKRHSNQNFRLDNSYAPSSLKHVFAQLKKNLGLPS